jgi:hypothetical protein
MIDRIVAWLATHPAIVTVIRQLVIAELHKLLNEPPVQEAPHNSEPLT